MTFKKNDQVKYKYDTTDSSWTLLQDSNPTEAFAIQSNKTGYQTLVHIDDIYLTSTITKERQLNLQPGFFS